MKLSLKILLPFSLSVSLAFANGPMSSCETQDLSDQFGAVRTQGNIGWCYANAAADLISYHFKDAWGGLEASATWIAFGYNIRENSSSPGAYIFHDGGDIADAIKSAATHGYSCPRGLDKVLMENGMKIGLREKLRSLEDLQAKFKKRNKSPQDMQEYTDYLNVRLGLQSVLSLIPEGELNAALDLPINEAAIAMAKSLCAPYKHRFPMKIEASMDLNQVLKRHQEYYDEELKEWIRYNESTKKWTYFDRKNRTQVEGKPLNLIDMITYHLKNRTPVGIGYYFDLISHDLKDRGGHAGVIVGSRFRNNTCQFKIRNSWGPGCSYKLNNKVQNVYGNKVVECEESGHVWVTAKDLNDSLDSITYFRKK